MEQEDIDYQRGMEAGEYQLKVKLHEWVIKRSQEILSYDEISLLKEFDKAIKKI